MAIPGRAEGAIHGPRGGSGWTSSLSSEALLTQWAVANASQFTATGGALTTEQIVYVVPQVSVVTASGLVQDALASDNIIGNLNKVYLGTSGVALAATLANSTLQFFLRRAGTVVGGGAFAGWGLAGNPAIAAYSSVAVPLLATNTALVVPGGGTVTAINSVLPLQPLDVITLSVVAAANINVPWLYAAVDIS